MRSPIFDQALQEQQAAQRWTLQSSKMLRVVMGPEVIAAQGAMVAYQGNIDFAYQGARSLGGMIKKALTNEGGNLMRVIGEPPAADQEHLHGRRSHRPRLGRGLPAGLLRPGIRRRPAQRGSAAEGRRLSRPGRPRSAPAGPRRRGAFRAGGVLPPRPQGRAPPTPSVRVRSAPIGPADDERPARSGRSRRRPDAAPTPPRRVPPPPPARAGQPPDRSAAGAPSGPFPRGSR